jgi:hypothetical protein
MEVVNRLLKWKWSTAITHLHTPNKFIPPACLPLQRTYERPVIKINTNNQQHKTTFNNIQTYFGITKIHKIVEGESHSTKHKSNETNLMPDWPG